MLEWELLSKRGGRRQRVPLSCRGQASEGKLALGIGPLVKGQSMASCEVLPLASVSCLTVWGTWVEMLGEKCFVLL